jgi:(p)ppGpp synthase/HD superfamily hydrolase
MGSREPLYGPRVGEALKLAADAFSGHARKGSGAPYLTHLLSVATLVMEHGGDEEQIVAAILHDYLEDIPGADEAVLVSRFGERVTRLVRALSDTTDATQPKAPWKPRKEAYLALLETAAPEVKLIAAADKLHNATSTLRDVERLGLPAFDAFTAPYAETLWYYREAARAVATDYRGPIVLALERTVRELHDAAARAGATL